jgi:hypothetical protein
LPFWEPGINRKSDCEFENIEIFLAFSPVLFSNCGTQNGKKDLIPGSAFEYYTNK